MSGYLNRTLRFDWPDLGEDCHAVIRNPLLEPMEPAEMQTFTSDPAEMLRRARLRQARWIIEWAVWDPADESDDPAVLPLPSVDPTVFDRAPVAVFDRIAEQVNELRRPFVPTPPNANGAGTTTSSRTAPVS
jgi:hypothetical protein